MDDERESRSHKRTLKISPTKRREESVSPSKDLRDSNPLRRSLTDKDNKFSASSTLAQSHEWRSSSPSKSPTKVKQSAVA